MLHDLMHFIHRPLVQIKADKLNSEGLQSQEGMESCTAEPSAGLQGLLILGLDYCAVEICFTMTCNSSGGNIDYSSCTL